MIDAAASWTIQQAGVAFGEEPVAPLAHRLRVDLEPLRGRFDRPVLLEHTIDHPTTALRRQRRVRVLRSSLWHESFLAWSEL